MALASTGGCIDESAENFDGDADVDDGSCQYLGCTDAAADNYNGSATTDDGSCVYSGCNDPNSGELRRNGHIG